MVYIYIYISYSSNSRGTNRSSTNLWSYLVNSPNFQAPVASSKRTSQCCWQTSQWLVNKVQLVIKAPAPHPVDFSQIHLFSLVRRGSWGIWTHWTHRNGDKIVARPSCTISLCAKIPSLTILTQPYLWDTLPVRAQRKNTRTLLGAAGGGASCGMGWHRTMSTAKLAA